MIIFSRSCYQVLQTKHLSYLQLSIDSPQIPFNGACHQGGNRGQHAVPEDICPSRFMPAFPLFSDKRHRPIRIPCYRQDPACNVLRPDLTLLENR